MPSLNFTPSSSLNVKVRAPSVTSHDSASEPMIFAESFSYLSRPS